MAKTKQELEEIKNRVAELSAVLQELSEEELLQVCGGVITAGKDEYHNIILSTASDAADDKYSHSKTKTGDTRGELTSEQRTPEYIHRQIFGKKFDEFFGN